MITNGIVQCVHTKYGLGAHFWDMKDEAQMLEFWKVRIPVPSAQPVVLRANLSAVDFLRIDNYLPQHAHAGKIQFILPVLPVNSGGPPLSHILSLRNGPCWRLGHRARIHPHLFLYPNPRLLETYSRQHMLGQQSHRVDELNRKYHNRYNCSCTAHPCCVEVELEKGEEVGGDGNIYPRVLVSIPLSFHLSVHRS